MTEKHAIVVLPAGVVCRGGRWFSTELSEEDNHYGAPGGKLRVLAASILARNYSKAMVIAAGGRGSDVPDFYPGERPALAEVLRDELVEAEIPVERIMLECVSNTTYQGLCQMFRLQEAHALTRLSLVTSRYHAPRVHAMIDTCFTECAASTVIEIIVAEDLLIAQEEKEWRYFIDDAYRSQWMAQRILREDQGILQIHAGTYQF